MLDLSAIVLFAAGFAIALSGHIPLGLILIVFAIVLWVGSKIVSAGEDKP